MKIILPILLIFFISLSGYLFYQNQNLQNPKTESVTPTPTPIIKDETANWKTITISDKDITFKIPVGFGFRSAYDDNFKLIESDQKITGNLFLFSANSLTKDRYQLSFDGMGNYSLVRFNIQSPDTQIKSGEGDKILDQILGTFKFLPLEKSAANKMMVKLYFHDKKLDPNVLECGTNNYVEKEIDKTTSPIKDTINALIASDVFEKHEKFRLESVNLKPDGTLILQFPYIGGFTTGGSCRISMITSQIIDTAMQFPQVKNVVFQPDVFQP